METTNKFFTTLNDAVVSSGLESVDYELTERERSILDSIHCIDVPTLSEHVIKTIDMIKAFPKTCKYFSSSFLDKAMESSDDLYKQVYLADYVLTRSI